MSIEPMLSVEQVAERVAVSHWAVRRAIGRGELRASKIAGRLRIEPGEVDAWIERGRVQPKATPVPERVVTIPPPRLGARRHDSYRARARGRVA